MPFQYFSFERSWWKLFQKSGIGTKIKLTIHADSIIIYIEQYKANNNLIQKEHNKQNIVRKTKNQTTK
jgi:hypothetical protein